MILVSKSMMVVVHCSANRALTVGFCSQTTYKYSVRGRTYNTLVKVSGNLRVFNHAKI